MRVIPATYGLHYFWQQLVFTEAALLANPETAAFAAPITELLGRWEGVRTKDLATQRAVIQAHARAAAADLGIDMAIRGVHNDALHAASQDREQPFFRKLFKSDIAEIVRFALRRQIETAEQLVIDLALSLIPAPLREKVTPLLAAVIAKGKEVLADRNAKVLARAEARIDIDELKADINAARTSLYGGLLAHAGKRRYPKSWAATFFMKVTTVGADEVDIEAEDDGPATPTNDPTPTPNP